MLRLGLSQMTSNLTPVQRLCQSMPRLSLLPSQHPVVSPGSRAHLSSYSSSNILLATTNLPTSAVPTRTMSYYKTGGADSLWNSMAGVSQQGKKRGRARNLMKKKDLNRGQRMGFGKAKVSWPGLTTKITSGAGMDTKVNEIEPLDEKTYSSYLEELEEAKKNTKYFRGGKRYTDPLDRGWTGGKPLGRKFGAPEATNKDYSFDNFDSVLLEFKTMFKMTGNLGRVRRNSILMVTGNGQGAVGYTVSPGKYGKNAAGLRNATNKAGLRLVYVDRYEDRTVYHDFFTQFGKTRIYVRQQPPGHGVVAHRAIKAICERVGIKDLYAKCEGSLNMQHITKAFMLGLLRQKTHQVLADEKKLHLVEMRSENDYFPKVVASPSDGVVRNAAEIGHNEILDFEMISFEGNLPEWRPAQQNPREGTPTWDKHLRKKWAYRSHDERVMISGLACLTRGRQSVVTSYARHMFWWGHDTIEDQAARKAEDKKKGLIAWTDPKKDLEKKKEFTWNPARIEEEANNTIGMTTGMTNHADVMKWTDRKFKRPMWHTWLTDPVHFREEFRRKTYNNLVISQVFLRERLQALGPDLAAAHFLCHRNCKVRFKGHTHWTELEPNGELKIPALYVPGWYVEAIEASTAALVYEGFQNFRNLDHLKYLDLSYCEYMDEWCMDRITGEFHDTLEYFNISGCKGINWNGLECIWRLRNLKTLVIKDMEHVQDLTLICLMLLDVLPNLKIEGADYLDLTLLEGTEFEHLMLDDSGSYPRLEPGEADIIVEDNEKQKSAN